jgi:hypothetical protein
MMEGVNPFVTVTVHPNTTIKKEVQNYILNYEKKVK